jgi:hypothetical protein
MLRGSPRLHFVHTALAGRPRTLIAIVAILAMLVFAVGGWAAWFSYELTAGLPDRTALKTIGDHPRRRRSASVHAVQGAAARSSD